MLRVYHSSQSQLYKISKDLALAECGYKEVTGLMYICIEVLNSISLVAN